MVALLSLKNIGDRTAEWLQAVGTQDGDDLAEVGVVEAYRRLKAAYPKQVTLNALWALQGAMLGIPWNISPTI